LVYLLQQRPCGTLERPVAPASAQVFSPRLSAIDRRVAAHRAGTNKKGRYAVLLPAERNAYRHPVCGDRLIIVQHCRLRRHYQ